MKNITIFHHIFSSVCLYVYPSHFIALSQTYLSPNASHMGPTVSQPVSQHTCRLYNRKISMCLCVGGITELYKAKNTESGETTEQQKYTKKMIHTECSDKKYVIWIVFGAVSLSISFSSFSLSFTWTPPFFRLSHLSLSAFNIGVSHFPALFRSFLAFWGYFRVWNIENFHIFFLLWRLPLLCASHDFSLGYFLFHFLFQYIIIAINFFFALAPFLGAFLSHFHIDCKRFSLGKEFI